MYVAITKDKIPTRDHTLRNDPMDKHPNVCCSYICIYIYISSPGSEGGIGLTVAFQAEAAKHTRPSSSWCTHTTYRECRRHTTMHIRCTRFCVYFFPSLFFLVSVSVIVPLPEIKRIEHIYYILRERSKKCIREIVKLTRRPLIIYSYFFCCYGHSFFSRLL